MKTAQGNAVPLHPQAPSAFFSRVSEVQTFLFDVDHCDNCGCDCVAANAVHGLATDIETYTGLGMIEATVPVSELVLVDSGKCVCSSCADGEDA
jgi:hypothetical protein